MVNNQDNKHSVSDINLINKGNLIESIDVDDQSSRLLSSNC